MFYIRGKKLILSQAIFSYCKLARWSIPSQLVTLGTVTMNMMDKPSNWFRTMLQWSGELHKETNHFGNLRKIERVYWLFRWTWGRGATKTYWWWKPPISTKLKKMWKIIPGMVEICRKPRLNLQRIWGLPMLANSKSRSWLSPNLEWPLLTWDGFWAPMNHRCCWRLSI